MQTKTGPGAFGPAEWGLSSLPPAKIAKNADSRFGALGGNCGGSMRPIRNVRSGGPRGVSGVRIVPEEARRPNFFHPLLAPAIFGRGRLVVTVFLPFPGWRRPNRCSALRPACRDGSDCRIAVQSSFPAGTDGPGTKLKRRAGTVARRGGIAFRTCDFAACVFDRKARCPVVSARSDKPEEDARQSLRKRTCRLGGSPERGRQESKERLSDTCRTASLSIRIAASLLSNTRIHRAANAPGSARRLPRRNNECRTRGAPSEREAASAARPSVPPVIRGPARAIRSRSAVRRWPRCRPPRRRSVSPCLHSST